MAKTRVAQPSTPADDRVLREQVERVVADLFGADREIVGYDKTLFPHIGSYDCHTVSVRLGGGDAFRFFLKDYGFSRQSKDAPEARRDRELRVYRDLLAGADLGTPAYYGSVWDERAGRFWLLIELVEGAAVDEVNVESGALAASWLARLHAHFAPRSEQLAASTFLTRLDADFFRAKASDAARDVARIEPEAVRRFERVLPHYEAAIPAMTAGPDTLVHGGYIPWHLVIDRDRDPVRIGVIDWELAALGSRFYDLAFFADDGGTSTIDPICDAYLAEASRSGFGVPDADLAHRAVHCFRLHRVFDWLSRSVERGFSAKKVSKLVDRAAKLAGQIPV